MCIQFYVRAGESAFSLKKKKGKKLIELSGRFRRQPLFVVSVTC